MSQKTHKSTAKKIKLTNPKDKKERKMLITHGGQDHFNARETGNQGRHKRRLKRVPKSIRKTLRKLMPYS